MSNYKRLRPANADKSYTVFEFTPEPIKIVMKALYKFCTTDQINIINNGFRRSQFSEQALIEDFHRGDIPKHDVVKDKHYQFALDLAEKMFLPKKKTRVVHFCDLRWYKFPLSSNVEAPFTRDDKLKDRLKFAHGNDEIPNTNLSMRNCYNYVFEKCRTWIHQIKDGIVKGNQLFFWITLHARSHLVEASADDKIRMVYGIPKLIIFSSCMFLWPIANYMRKGFTPIAWGFETLSGGAYRLYRDVSNLRYTPGTVLCIDWKSFDKRVEFAVVDDVYSLLEDHIDFSGYIPTREYPREGSFRDEKLEERLRRLWKWHRNAVKFAPIRLPDGSEYKRLHSNLPSGVFETQVLGSMINFIIIVTVLSEMGIELDEETLILILGDDSFVVLKRIIPKSQYDEFLRRFAEIALRRFNAVLSIKKTSMHPSLEGSNFLGYEFRNAVPHRDELKLLASLLHPEKPWTLESLAGKAVGIAYASAGQSKLVYNVCKDIHSYVLSLGKVPNVSAIADLQYRGVASDLINVGEFPTFEELSSKLFCVNELNGNYFPMDHFLADY